MPTENPRVNVTLSVSLDTLVSRLASHQRVSKSQVLRELLEAAEPALQEVVALMDAASKASAGVLAGLAPGLQRNLEHAEDSAAVMVSRMSRMQRDLVSQAEEVRGKRPARVAGVRGALAHSPAPPGGAPKRGNPPASNRGVKSAKQAKGTSPSRATTRGRS
jgi:hypothetical protein